MNMWIKVSTIISLILKRLFLDSNRVLVFLDDFYFQLLIFMLNCGKLSPGTNNKPKQI